MSTHDLQLSQYKIIRKLGAGGMAEVFLADKVGAAGFSKRVAIKTILAGNAPTESISLFLDEARVASFLQHSGIVQTLDLGFESSTLFIAMEYVAGPTLSRVVYDLKKMGGLLPWPVVAYVGAKVANALDYAHRRATDNEGQALSLIHRDISPQNILITRDGVVKLTDFGVARASIQMHKTKTGQVRGKAAYMSPEQVRAKELDGRTDMFALGLVLYEAFTGYRPFQRKADIQSMRAVLGDTPPPIGKRNSSVPPELIAIVDRCIQKNADDRFAHCGELEAALQKEYGKILDSDITDKITEIMNDVFGTQGWEKNTDQEPIESWQPTLHVDEHGQVKTPTLKKLEDPSIADEIADLLNQTPKQSQSGALSVPRTHSDLGLKAEALLVSSATPLTPGSTTNTAFETRTSHITQHARRRSKQKALVIVVLALILTVATYVLFREPARFDHEQAIPTPKPRQGLKAVQGKSTPNSNSDKPQTTVSTPSKPRLGKQRKTIRSKRRRGIRGKSIKQKKSAETKAESESKTQVSLSVVLNLAERAEAVKDSKLKEDLETIILKMTEDRPLSVKDRKLVKRAKKQLR